MRLLQRVDYPLLAMMEVALDRCLPGRNAMLINESM